jgi:hypothetical protein
MPCVLVLVMNLSLKFTMLQKRLKEERERRGLEGFAALLEEAVEVEGRLAEEQVEEEGELLHER